MSKIRVYELARLLKMPNKELIKILKDLGVEVKTHMSMIDSETAKLIEETLKEEPKEEIKTVETKDIKTEKKQFIISSESTVKDLAEKIGVSPAEVVKRLIENGLMVPANAKVDDNIVEIISDAYDILIELKEEEAEGQVKKIDVDVEVKEERLQPRPPIVTVMGHVDHGKTTLLDAIRSTNVAEREAGGITQHIGASVVEHDGRSIVFLDTPGHEAFTSLRARGAQVTDIAVLVVAADDGVMPQTVEAIDHAKAAGVPIIVAINKIDKPNADIERVKRQLSEHGLVPEEWGGDTVTVNVSAKKKIGIDELLEMILLVADLLELRADPEANPSGVVIEAKLEKGRGPVGTVIIKQGTLKVGDVIVTGTTYGRVRAMIDDKGKQVKKALPGMPVEILGLQDVPKAGDIFYKVKSEKEARQKIEEYIQKQKEQKESKPKKITLEELYRRLQEEEIKQLKLIIKADVQGSLEAIETSIKKLETDEIKITILHQATGRITESDILLASASEAIVIGFNVQPERKARQLAESEGVQIRTYRVIYDLIDDVKAALEGMLEPEYKEEFLGRAEIRAIFKVPKVGKVAGCYVTDGVIPRNANVRIVRDGVVIYDGNLASLKRFKDDVREVQSGFECGMSFQNFQDFKQGDIVEAYKIIEIKKSLNV